MCASRVAESLLRGGLVEIYQVEVTCILRGVLVRQLSAPARFATGKSMVMG